MDGFTYQNIFDTKGIEYLIVIAFLLILVPFWIVLNKKVQTKNKLKKSMRILSVNSINIPQGLFYSPNHTWTLMEKSGEAKLGLDDLVFHIVGKVGFSNLRKEGEKIQKGDLVASLNQDGRSLNIFSPISGEITNINPSLHTNPELVNADPYSRGWMYKIKPNRWKAEILSCYLAGEASTWSKKELEKFKDFLAASVQKYKSDSNQFVLQDGGELIEHPLSELPKQMWQDFQKEFLDLPS